MVGRGRGAGKKNRDDGWEEWGGYMKAKQQKLQDQYGNDGIQSDIFNGISIFVNGYTKPSSDELKRMVIENGGIYQHYLYKLQVTHIIATSIANSKISKDLKHMKIVKPEWITDSISCGKLLSYIPYQLYTAQTRIQSGMGGFATDTTCVSTTISKSHDTSASISNIIQNHSSTFGSKKFQEISDKTEEKSPNTSINQYRNFSEDVDVDKMLDSDHTDDDSILGIHFNDNEGDENLSNTDKNHSTRSAESLTDANIEKLSDENINRDMKAKDNKFEKLPKRLSLKQDRTKVTANNEMKKSVNSETANVLKNIAVAPRNTPQQSNLVDNQKASSSSGTMAKAGDSNFISEFYGNSRLHHISMWGAESKEYVNKLQAENTENYPGREKLRKFHIHSLEGTGEINSMMSVCGKPQRVLMHVDMDCFFVSVGLLERPDLKGKPVAVTHSKNKGLSAPIPGSNPDFEKKLWNAKHANQTTGSKSEYIDDEEESVPPYLRKFDKFNSFAEIASCSYEARKAGVKNGMFMGPAREKCPELKTIPYHFDKYQEISRILYDTVASFTHDIEAVSCDEMLVDCTDLLSDTGATPLEFATILRQEIYDKTGCCASAGLGSNILLAKLSTRKAKPNGQFYLQDYDVLDFIKTQSVRDIPGVGWSMSKKLTNLNITNCGDLQSLPLLTLQKEFGPKTGQSLYKSCRGQDERQIKMKNARKSVSAEINYGIRFQKDSDCVKFLHDLAKEVHNRLMKVKLKGKVITLKVKERRADAPIETAKFMGHGICNKLSKSLTLPLATNDSACISKECWSMLQSLKIDIADIRGIGIQMQRLEAEAGLKPDKTSRGNQSILNYAVAKNITTSTSNVKEPHNLNYSPLIITPGISSVTKTSQSHFEKKNDFISEMSNKGDNLPQVDSNAYKDFYIDNERQSEVNVNLSSQPIVEKHRVTLMSGYTLMDELARRKTAKGFMPPLPTLRGFSPPESGISTPLNAPDSLATPSNKIDSNMDYFPSPSQIDPEVLKELPPEIRKQIEKEMKSRQTKDKIETMARVHTSQEAGCSYWPGNVSDLSVMTSRSPEDNTPIVALPSPSQLDLECLNALPKELQDELNFAYKQQTYKRMGNTHLRSPTKINSPRRNKKTSPTFKVPKGRATKKRKLSPKKLLFSNKKISESSNQIQNVVDDVINIDDDDVIHVAEDNITCQHAETNPDMVAPVTESVNLCGATDIIHVRSLLKEWLISCPVPQEEDLEVITTYISQLILDKNLEHVDLVLKYLYRNICKLNSSLWEDMLCCIVSNTQGLIHSLHGSHLNLQYMKAIMSRKLPNWC